jgi:hypothetical protein
MSVGAFTDKHYRPTDDEVLEMVGPMAAVWRVLIQHLREGYPAEEDFKFLYGKNYGWALRFRIRGKLLASLYPAAGGVTVQVNLGPEAVQQALSMALGENVRGVIERATAYSEGRWLFIPVLGEQDLRDVKALIALRAETKRLQLAYMAIRSNPSTG